MTIPLAAASTSSARALPNPLRATDLAVGLRVLSDLLDSGLPVSRALAAFEEIAPNGWQAGMGTMRSAIREGRSLASALDESVLGVPAITIGIVRAGEAGGGIAAAMRRAAEHAESSAATRDAIRAALAYPTIVAVAGGSALALMVGVVLPKFAVVLSDIGQTLPASTRMVLAAAGLARGLALPLLVVVVGVAIAVHRSQATREGRRAIHRALLQVPIVGRVRAAAATSRFCAALSALLASGVPLRSAMLHAAHAIDDEELAARALEARTRIAAGERVAGTLRSLEVITPTATRLIGAGEESGRLSEMLQYAAQLEQARAERLTKTAVRLIEPTLILSFAAVVGVVAAAMLQAVYAVRPV